MLREETLYLSVGELAKKIEVRSLSPVELTESYLARAEKIGPKLNAFATLTPDLALEQAHAAEREINRGHYRGPLHGIPYAAKDLLAVKGYPTTWGAKPYAKQTFDYNAAVIEHLNLAGAVLIGKAAMIELAGGMGYRFASASATGAARNPWNTGCWTCGSSAGSGAIVSAALAAWAVGTETWGSIVCPAAFCGVTGLRPTFGRTSRYGAMALAYSMDKIGPLARTADDCARVLSVMAAHDIRDPGTMPLDRAAFPYSSAQDLGGRTLRVGWATNAWASKDVQPGVAKATKQAMAVLRKHVASVKNTNLPEGPWDEAAMLIVAAEGAAAFEDLLTSGRAAELTDPLGQVAGYLNQQVSASDYLHADRVRALAQKKMADLFDDFDVLAAPGLPVTATPLGMNLETDLSFPDPLGALGNMCGMPAVSVPCGFDEKGLPVGLLFVARAGNDLAVVRAARTFQQFTNWHKKRPPIQ
jgi:aspartyl-tRNA(Asn)/glutamyl-tRNA(Gln) amidotransferase subunit A